MTFNDLTALMQECIDSHKALVDAAIAHKKSLSDLHSAYNTFMNGQLEAQSPVTSPIQPPDTGSRFTPGKS